MGTMTPKEGAYLKMETDTGRLHNIADRLQNIVIDYTRPQKVGHGLQNYR